MKRLGERRGQESAPIELMIGVTVLTFVLVIAYYVYSNAASSQCIERIRASSAQFARTIEEVAQQGPGTTRYVTVDFSCDIPDVKVSYLTIAQGPPATCQSNLGTDTCYMFYVIGNESGQLTVIHSELLRNVGENVGIKYSSETEDIVMRCDYSSLLAYINPNQGYGNPCGADNFIKPGQHSFKITREKDPSGGDYVRISTPESSQASQGGSP